MIEPVIIGNATLYLGDCLRVMPSLFHPFNNGFDCIVTDPPYGVDGGLGGQAREFGKAKYGSEFSDTQENVARLVKHISRFCHDSIPCAITPGNRCLFMYPKPRDVGCFWTPAAMNNGPWGLTTFHPILYYGKDYRAGKGALPSGKQVTEMAEKNGHPCPKPIKAWTWLVDKVAAPNTTVLDPFMGSGTTGVACMNLDRKFIGIEIEPKYFDIACERIDQAQRQIRMFA